MISLKVIFILFALVLATLTGAYTVWSHQQQAAAAAIKAGGERMIEPDMAKKIQTFKDR